MGADTLPRPDYLARLRLNGAFDRINLPTSDLIIWLESVRLGTLAQQLRFTRTS